MLPLFSHPLAFWGILSIPVLVAIYFLRNRFRRRTVSSLMLWMEERQTREGGRLFERLPLPLWFYVELAIILLLILGAAGPRMLTGSQARPLIVILDNSFSMLAGDTSSPKTNALSAIESEIAKSDGRPVRFILAGQSPQLIGEVTRKEALADVLTQWNCGAINVNLREAITLASALETKQGARLMVITDHAPENDFDPNSGTVQWMAFGAARPNCAIVNANWNGERCLLEIANLSGQSLRTELTLETGTAQATQSTLDLEANEVRRLIFKVNQRVETTGNRPPPSIRARLSDDQLLIDNEVIVFPPPRKKIRTDLRIANETLKQLFESALVATDQVQLTAAGPELVITDQPTDTLAGPGLWTLRILADQSAESFLGPFVVNQGHPLAEGLALNGVIWGAGRPAAGTPLAGTPVITAGNVPLVTETERSNNRHDIVMHFRPDLSTLQTSPNWPILVFNLLNWRASQSPGIHQSMYRLGTDAAMTVDPETVSLDVVTPQKQTQSVVIREKTVSVPANQVGVFEIHPKQKTSSASPQNWYFAVNALSQTESNLMNCVTGQWGNWLNAPNGLTEYRSIAWIFLLLAAAGLTLHSALIARNAQGSRA
ncbi:MAG: BatA domain-containing protein [Acidobacteria bacterium]|nr:BatA domain-containing protein [Acidobacteriota bacterium]